MRVRVARGPPTRAGRCTQWTFVTATDTSAKCDQKRADRLANAESDLGVDAESLSPGTKLAAVFDARRRSRCVADGDYFAAPAGK